ncbi:hypothetical protein PAAL109150_22535 [Paenibacillus alkaliterrae]
MKLSQNNPIRCGKCNSTAHAHPTGGILDIQEQMNLNKISFRSLPHVCRTGRPAVLRNGFRLACKYRKVPAECFEHLHLVSFPYEYPSQALYNSSETGPSSRKLWRLIGLNTSILAFLLESHYLSYSFFLLTATRSLKIIIPFFPKSTEKAYRLLTSTDLRQIMMKN